MSPGPRAGCPTGNSSSSSWTGETPLAKWLLSRCCCATGRWCFGLAATSSASRPTLKMPFRRRFWCWSRGPDRWGGSSRSAAGSTESLAAWRPGRRASRRVAELGLAEDELNTLKTGNAGPTAQIKRAELGVLRARFGLEKAQGRRKLLSDYSKPKKIKELQTAVEQARSAELAKKATWELEQGRVRKLEKQISACRIRAPADGKVVYAKVERTDGGLGPPEIGVGEVVYQRQLLFEIVPASGAEADRR